MLTKHNKFSKNISIFFFSELRRFIASWVTQSSDEDIECQILSRLDSGLVYEDVQDDLTFSLRNATDIQTFLNMLLTAPVCRSAS